MALRIDMPYFHGNPGQSIEHWLNIFANSTELHNVRGQQRCRLMQFYLKEHAEAYFHSLSENIKTDYDELTRHLATRFSGNEGIDADLEILSLQQQPNESVASFFTRFLKVTNNKG